MLVVVPPTLGLAGVGRRACHRGLALALFLGLLMAATTDAKEISCATQCYSQYSACIVDCNNRKIGPHFPKSYAGLTNMTLETALT